MNVISRTSSYNDRDGAGPVARSCNSESFLNKPCFLAQVIDKHGRYSTIRAQENNEADWCRLVNTATRSFCEG
jgi:hypothetical protein